MSGKTPNVSQASHERSTPRIIQRFHNLGECLCGCEEIVRGLTSSAFVDGHDSGLVWQVLADEYDGAAGFANAHPAVTAGSSRWELTLWRPETAVGQQARGRMRWVLPLQFHGFVELNTVNSGEHGEEAEALGSEITEAGARLDVELGDPFLWERRAHEMSTAGPIWQAAWQKLLTFYERRPVPASSDNARFLAYTAARASLEDALDFAPDPPEEFVVPGQVAFNVLQSGLREEAEKMLRDATEAYVFDVDSWVILAAEAFKADRLDEALGFAEAAVAVVERSLPDRFSGTLRSSWFDNNAYLLSRRVLVFVLWKLDRFDDAYRVVVDTVWLDPHDGQNVRRYLGHIKCRVPFVDAFVKGGSPI